MVNIFEDMASLKYKTYRQGSAPKELPANFYTIWNDYSEDIVNGDNESKIIEHKWTLIFYTKKVNNLYVGLEEAINLLKSKGYIISGLGSDLSAKYEDWFARTIDVKKIERI